MKQQSTGRGFAYLSIAELLVKIMSLVYVPVLVHILGDVGHGIYAISYDAFTLIYVLTNEGIQRGISKLISELHAQGNPRDAVRAFRLSRTMLIFGGLVASILLYIMAPYIANASDAAQATLSIRVLSPTILITSVLAAYRGYFLGRSFVTANALSKIVEQLVNVVVSLLAAYLLMRVSLVYGVAGGALGTSIGALAGVALLVREYYKARLHKVKRQDQNPDAVHHTNKELVRRLLSYATPITLTAGMMHIGGFIDMFIVNSRLTVAGLSFKAAKTAYSQLARYKNLLYAPNTILVALAAVLLPGISAARAVNNQEEVGKKITYAVKMVFLVTIPSFVGMAVLAGPIYDILYPGRGGVELLQMGAVTVVFLGFIQVQNVIFQGLGKFYWGSFTMLAGILTKLVMNYFLVAIPSVNIQGAVISHFMNFLIPTLANHYLITKVLGYKIRLGRSAKGPMISAAAMGVVIYLLSKVFAFVKLGYAASSLLTFVNILAGVVVYMVFMLLTGGITRQDLTEMSPRLLRLIPAKLRAKMK